MNDDRSTSEETDRTRTQPAPGRFAEAANSRTADGRTTDRADRPDRADRAAGSSEPTGTGRADTTRADTTRTDAERHGAGRDTTGRGAVADPARRTADGAGRETGPDAAHGTSREAERVPSPRGPGADSPSADQPQATAALRKPAVVPAPRSPVTAPAAAAGATAATGSTGSTGSGRSAIAVGDRQDGRGFGGWLDPERVDVMSAEWEAVQSGFVDDPAGAVERADALVAKVADLVTEAVRRRRESLHAEEGAPVGTGSDTEELRLALRDYRTVLDRLLAA
ncbi:hypothetical protein [Kitasatospora sp. NBC_01539]|uniref:hypothetical protein n=1 Tax=Kitasatospora sp. NBC_01539 TaxID=2903577 RepID=UPI0038602030